MDAHLQRDLSRADSGTSRVSPASAFKRCALCNLLRQSVVAACTALETFLPILLRDNLPEVIGLRGRDFVPKMTDFKNTSRPHFRPGRYLAPSG